MPKLLNTPYSAEKLFGWFERVIILMLCLLFAYNCFASANVKGASMEDSYFNGDWVMISRYFNSYEAEDVIVFHSDVWEKDMIKRIIARGGDKIRFVKDNSAVHLEKYDESIGDFAAVDEWYIKNSAEIPMTTECFRTGFPYGETIEIAQDEFFVMGDNRNDSTDSRSFGTISRSCIIGKVIKTLQDDKILRFLYNAH